MINNFFTLINTELLLMKNIKYYLLLQRIEPDFHTKRVLYPIYNTLTTNP